MLARIVPPGQRVAGAAELMAIETGFVLMQAFRLFLIASALRFNVSFAQSTTLVIAVVSAAAIGFLPAGLGAREAIAAVLSPIVGFPADRDAARTQTRADGPGLTCLRAFRRGTRGRASGRACRARAWRDR